MLIPESSKCIDVAVYSLKSDSWRTYTNIALARPPDVELVFLDENLHWLESDSTGKLLVSLDTVCEIRKQLPVPRELKNFKSLSVSVLGGCLYVYGNNKNGVQVWMYIAHDSWTRVITIDRGVFPPGPLFFRLKDFLGDGVILFETVFNMTGIYHQFV